jgi:four helix bundle protein
MSVQFDHERLDVYCVALDFISWVSNLMEEIRSSGSCATAEVRDQLDRASISVLLNIAEGNAKPARRLRARFFGDARGSAAECAACLDILVAKSVSSAERIAEGRALLHRVMNMLTKLVLLFDDRGLVREASAEYDSSATRGDNSDHEQEHEYEQDSA